MSSVSKLGKKIVENTWFDFNIFEEVVRFMDHVYMPKVSDSRCKILSEAHNSLYIAYPGSVKMYQDLKKPVW